MIATQRYLAFAIFTICALVLIAHFRGGIASQARIRYDTLFAPATKQHPDGRFHWADVPVRYPVRDLTSLPSGKPKRLPKVQHDFKDQSQALKQKPRQAAVKATFERAWKAYRKFAWMKDEVTPISASFKNTFGGWGATLVDSLDTLWIMGLKDEFEEAVEASMAIDLGTSTTETVNVFETTIRHLGGFLSAYDLSGDKRLLEKAKEFGEMLLKAFDTPNRMPVTRWKPQEALHGKQEASNVVLLAEIGSLTMEFAHLSQVTGDMRYYDAVDRIMRVFLKQLDETHLPGMFPVVVDAKELDFTKHAHFTLSAMADSFYEYLPKMHALLGGTEPMYEKLYSRSMETAIKYNIWRPMVPGEADILMSGNVKADMSQPPSLEPQGQHLACFVGGMFALGGRLFEQEDHVKIGQKLTDGCIWTYEALPMGIMPEVFYMVPCPSRTGQCKWDEQKWKNEVRRVNDRAASVEDAITELRLPKGFTSIADRRYILRPEAIESVFILYRTTGQEYLLDAAWDMFQSIINATETPLANAAVADVTFELEFLTSHGARVNMDGMESFWMAETLKYFYLIFGETSLISLDEYVFNTEAHPFKRALPR